MTLVPPKILLYITRSAFFLLLFFCHSIRHLTLYRDTAYDNLLPVSATVTSSVPTKSKIQCAGLCRDEVSCNSFFYNDVSRKCLRQRVVYLAPPQVDALPEPGWQYFRLRSGKQLTQGVWMVTAKYEMWTTWKTLEKHSLCKVCRSQLVKTSVCVCVRGCVRACVRVHLNLPFNARLFERKNV